MHGLDRVAAACLEESPPQDMQVTAQPVAGLLFAAPQFHFEIASPEKAPRSAHQQREQLHAFGRQPDVDTGKFDRHGPSVETEIAYSDGAAREPAGAALVQ